jgi:hypothetical protein
VVLAASVGFVASSMALPTQDMQAPVAPKQSVGTILSPGLPSDVEQKLGIPRNSANPEYRGCRGIPSEDYRRGRGWDVERGWGIGGMGDMKDDSLSARIERIGADWTAGRQLGVSPLRALLHGSLTHRFEPQPSRHSSPPSVRLESHFPFDKR